MFSIIIPCWNSAATLAATLDSVVRQSLRDWEAIILDDGSTDETRSIAQIMTQTDPRIRLVTLANGGPSRTRNIGAFNHARGDYLAFLDSDDQWAPNKLARCAARFARPDAPDALYAKVGFFKDTTQRIKTFSNILPRPITPFDLLCENAVCTMSNLVVRRSLFCQSGGFDPDIVHAEDLEWLIRFTAAGARIEGIDEVLTFYRTSDRGLSADLPAMQAGWRAARQTARRLGVKVAPDQERQIEAVHLRYLARRALRVKSPRFAALGFALRGVGASPRAFFENPWRGGMTFAGACLEPFLPARLRSLAFSR